MTWTSWTLLCLYMKSWSCCSPQNTQKALNRKSTIWMKFSFCKSSSSLVICCCITIIFTACLYMMCCFVLIDEGRSFPMTWQDMQISYEDFLSFLHCAHTVCCFWSPWPEAFLFLWDQTNVHLLSVVPQTQMTSHIFTGSVCHKSKRLNCCKTVASIQRWEGFSSYELCFGTKSAFEVGFYKRLWTIIILTAVDTGEMRGSQTLYFSTQICFFSLTVWH